MHPTRPFYLHLPLLILKINSLEYIYSEGVFMNAEIAEYFLISLGVFMVLSVIIGQSLLPRHSTKGNQDCILYQAIICFSTKQWLSNKTQKIGDFGSHYFGQLLKSLPIQCYFPLEDCLIFLNSATSISSIFCQTADDLT